MNALIERLLVLCEGAFREAEDRLELGGPGHSPGGDVADPDAHGGSFGGQPEPLLTLPQPFLDSLPLGDIQGGADDLSGAPVRTTREDPVPAVKPAPLPVPVPHPVLDQGTGRGARREESAQMLGEPRPIVRMDQDRHHLRLQRRYRVGSIAEAFRERGVGRDAAPLRYLQNIEGSGRPLTDRLDNGSKVQHGDARPASGCLRDKTAISGGGFT